jgi:hypothetical protein
VFSAYSLKDVDESGRSEKITGEECEFENAGARVDAACRGGR